MEIVRADIVKKVPPNATKERWNGEQAQYWARNDVLCGGPPEKPLDPSTNKPIEWADIKKMGGKNVRIRAKPMGLIVYDDNGNGRYYPGDATTSHGNDGFAVGTTTEEMQKHTAQEKRIRVFTQNEIYDYNKNITKRIRNDEGRTTTREFWECGQRLRIFLTNEKKITKDMILYSLEQWGRGQFGYGKQWYEYALMFYDWNNLIDDDDPIFSLSETRIMNIIRATKNNNERDLLVGACVDGPFSSLSDEEFKWITGQSKGTFPLDGEYFDDIRFFGAHLLLRGKLLDEEVDELVHLCDFIKGNS